MPAIPKKKLPHGSVLHAIYDAYNAGSKHIDLYTLEVTIGISGWDLRALVEDLKNSGYLIEDEDGLMITNAGLSVARSKWV